MTGDTVYKCSRLSDNYTDGQTKQLLYPACTHGLVPTLPQVSSPEKLVDRLSQFH